MLAGQIGRSFLLSISRALSSNVFSVYLDKLLLIESSNEFIVSATLYGLQAQTIDSDPFYFCAWAREQSCTFSYVYMCMVTHKYMDLSEYIVLFTIG